MSFAIGLQCLRSLCETQKPIEWRRAKLSPGLFTTYEMPMFEWVQNHLKKHHVLPQIETFCNAFPAEITPIQTVEPPSYYLALLENRHFYKRIDQANLASQAILKANQDDHVKALEVLRGVVNEVVAQKYRVRILDVGKEAGKLVMSAYHSVGQDVLAEFGWHYMDEQAGALMPGDLVSFVGRPAMGKTFLMLHMALHNWHVRKQNTLLVSMEMQTLPIAQRIAAMYTGSPIGQIKQGGLATLGEKNPYQKFSVGLKELFSEEAKFYVVDGNLAASVDDIYGLADILQCRVVGIDGAYLVKHKNERLDRITRVAENVQLMKQAGSDMGAVTFCSWQLNREAEKKTKEGKQVGVEDIGLSDAIGQISSLVLGLFEHDGVETIKKRKVSVMKGRNGEIGQFSISWDFANMNFDQVEPVPGGGVTDEHKEMQWV